MMQSFVVNIFIRSLIFLALLNILYIVEYYLCCWIFPNIVKYSLILQHFHISCWIFSFPVNILKDIEKKTNVGDHVVVCFLYFSFSIFCWAVNILLQCCEEKANVGDNLVIAFCLSVFVYLYFLCGEYFSTFLWGKGKCRR